jgi:hypothetical protein
MIVRAPRSGLRLFPTMHGPVLARIWKSLVVATLLAIFVSANHRSLLHHKSTLTTIPFLLMGLSLTLLPRFRNTPPDLRAHMLDALCRAIGVALCQPPGHGHLPAPPLQPANDCLS